MPRIGLFGAGAMARQHARTLRALGEDVRIVGVADRNPRALEAFAGHQPDVRAFSNPEELLAELDVDAIHVCTPAPTHFALAEAAVRAGCHVYVEKPFTTSAAEADGLLQLARARRVLVTAGHQLLFARPTPQGAALMPALGRPVHIESFFSFRPARGRTLGLDEQLLDILPHPTYLLLHFLANGRVAPRFSVHLDLDRNGTLHGLVETDGPTGTLCVTLTGRPIESYVRIVGTNGTIHLDYVRGTVQRQIGPGSSSIDKVMAPYRGARQLVSQSTAALLRRLRDRRAGYPGLREAFRAFYDAIQGDPDAAALPEWNIRETSRLVEQAERLLEARRPDPAASDPGAPTVLVTGGTGTLGSALVRELAREGAHQVRSVSRRAPAAWDAVARVDYRTADLGSDPLEPILENVDTVVHCAAETAGGWEEHRRNSVASTERLIHAMRAAGVRRLLHVSSIAVLADEGAMITEDTPLIGNPRSNGPYVWGKLEGERVARARTTDLGITLRLVRPGPIIESDVPNVPGRLGKRVGNLLVAVGGPREPLGVIELSRLVEFLGWIVQNFDEAPPVLNALEPVPWTRRQMVDRIRRCNPDLRVIWIPRWAMRLGTWTLRMGARVRRRGEPSLDLAAIFADRRYDTRRSAELAARIGRARTAGEGDGHDPDEEGGGIPPMLAARGTS